MSNVFKFAEGKAKNRRLNIWVLIEDDTTTDDSLMVIIETKRLIDFKTREIIHTRINYGFYTFLMLQEIMFCIANDFEFKKKTNRLMKQFETNKMTFKSNIKVNNL